MRNPIADAGMEPTATSASGKPPASPAVVPAIPTERDLRLDLFRGLALWLIFLDHIPTNIVSWVTIRNYGFSDATEIFIFISGYTAAFVYGALDARTRLRGVERAHPQAGVADLCRAHFPVRDLHGGDRLSSAPASRTHCSPRK